MNLYLLETQDFSYDEYDAFIIAADTESEARSLCVWRDVWRDNVKSTCKIVGVAADGVERGIVLGSFNAG